MQNNPAMSGASLHLILIQDSDTVPSPYRSVLALWYFLLTWSTNTCATGGPKFQSYHWISSGLLIGLLSWSVCFRLGLIVFRLWWIRRRIQSMPNFTGDPNYKRVSSAAAIIVESGAVYSLCLIVLIVLYMTKSWSAQIVQDAMPQIIVSTSSYIMVSG